MIEVLPVRTPTVPPATHTNCYKLGRTVIDPGSPWADEQSRLADWAGPIERILLTHHHADHVGGVADLAARTGAEVWAHRDAQVSFPVHVRLEEGDRVDTGDGVLECLHTPGHADGHLCYRLEGTGHVIAGDMVAGVGTIVLVPPEGDLAVYLDSLARLETLGDVLYPAHGPVIADGPALVRQYIAHRHNRSAQIEAALTEPRDPVGIAEVVYAGIPGVDPRLAAIQVVAHLRWLAGVGRVREEDGRWRRV